MGYDLSKRSDSTVSFSSCHCLKNRFNSPSVIGVFFTSRLLHCRKMSIRSNVSHRHKVKLARSQRKTADSNYQLKAVFNACPSSSQNTVHVDPENSTSTLFSEPTLSWPKIRPRSVVSTGWLDGKNRIVSVSLFLSSMSTWRQNSEKIIFRGRVSQLVLRATFFKAELDVRGRAINSGRHKFFRNFSKTTSGRSWMRLNNWGVGRNRGNSKNIREDYIMVSWARKWVGWERWFWSRARMSWYVFDHSPSWGRSKSLVGRSMLSSRATFYWVDQNVPANDGQPWLQDLSSFHQHWQVKILTLHFWLQFDLPTVKKRWKILSQIFAMEHVVTIQSFKIIQVFITSHMNAAYGLTNLNSRVQG